jgi:sulfite exporter TauE/SafE
MMSFLAGLALGFASSAHCAAMCGPLVVAAGRVFARRSRASDLAQHLLHHAARILVYALLAVPAGLAGETMAMRGFGRVMAIAAGVLLLGAAAGSLRVRGFGRLSSALSTAVARAASPALRWSRLHPFAGPVLTGALNGLLPCGLVYGALTVAAATGRGVDAVILMTGFGLGTSAVLLAISSGVTAVPASLRVRLRPLAPVALAVTAAILIARGVVPAHQHAAAPLHHHMHQ